MKKLIIPVILILLLIPNISFSNWYCGGKWYYDCSDPKFPIECCAWHTTAICIPKGYDCNTAFGCEEIYVCKSDQKGYCVYYNGEYVPLCFDKDALGGEDTIKYCGGKWWICNDADTVSFCVNGKFVCCSKSYPYYSPDNDLCYKSCPVRQNYVLKIVDNVCYYEKVEGTCNTNDDCNYDEICVPCDDNNERCKELEQETGADITGICEKLDCDDGNPYSFDYAENHECKHSYTYPGCANSYQCKWDELCDKKTHICYKVNCSDNNICTIDKLDKENETCVHTWIEGCCLTDEHCQNGLICKDNVCVEPTIIDRIIRFIKAIISKLFGTGSDQVESAVHSIGTIAIRPESPSTI